MKYNRNMGITGEEDACAYLEEKGFEIIEKNFRAGKAGEIDIIAKKDRLMIFVEVKSRSTDTYGGARYSLNEKRKRRFRFVADFYLHKNYCLKKMDLLFRFDMIAIENDTIEWIHDIFR